jgi:geranylgeranyl diphosphate synthase, type II
VNLDEYLSGRRQLVEKALDDMLPREDNRPALLHKAMRYSVFAGGKRIRPILAMAGAEAVGGSAVGVLPLAVALECIHTYSLIHDDLPAMDNDDLRRGKPTSHKVFGEAVAILAGDALLTFGLGILGTAEVVRCHRAERLLAVIGELAHAAGSINLIAGQVVDITAEGKPIDEALVDFIVRKKTAALIRASLSCGARLAGGTTEQVEILSIFGEYLGAAFQIKDDLLDLEGDPTKLGKAVNKDQTRGKATYPRLVGETKAKAMMRALVESALEVIKPLGSAVEPLARIGAYIGNRLN